MGKRKQYDQYMRTIQSWIDRMTQPSPYEGQINSELGSITNFLNSKDYRNLPTGVNVDLLPLAEHRRMQSMMRGTGDNVAKGALNADAVRNQRELDDNQLARDWGGAYEQKVGDLMNRKDNLLNALQGFHTNRMSAGVQGSQMQLQNFLNRPKGFNWGSILGMAAQAAPGIIAAI